MTNYIDESLNLEQQVQAIATEVRDLARQYQGDCLALLGLLRALEHLHREIQEGAFQKSLPDNRQALYSLVKDIEEKGGWPYIDRMRLRLLLVQLSETESDSTEPTEDSTRDAGG